MNARLEVWFLPEQQVSVSLVTEEAGLDLMRELLEVTTVAAIAAGVIANLPKEHAAKLSGQLEAVTVPEPPGEVPTGVGDFVFVAPGTGRGSKGFEGTLKMKNGLPVARWKPRGFRLFGREVQDYSQTAVMAIVLHVMGGLSLGSRAMLAETVQSVGQFGATGGIGLRNHPVVAMTAVNGALETVNAAGIEPD